MVHRPIANKTRLIRNVRPCISISFFTGERDAERCADDDAGIETEQQSAHPLQQKLSASLGDESDMFH